MAFLEDIHLLVGQRSEDDLTLRPHLRAHDAHVPTTLAATALRSLSAVDVLAAFIGEAMRLSQGELGIGELRRQLGRSGPELAFHVVERRRAHGLTPRPALQERAQ
ncbi:MAG: hypothetical protein IPF98_19445 [Gemmatimonadetes bacterium]|nr:hypothetical protein [Gemmatimonadota bacterium]